MAEEEMILEVTAYAKEFVDSTITRAIDKIREIEVEQIEKNSFTIENGCPSCPGCQINEFRSDLDYEWPTSEKMSVREGLKCLKKMMMKWKSESAMYGWKFHAEFIGLDTDGLSDFYSYQVRWSFPTPAYPEPQVTVSILFTIGAARKTYPDCPIDVSYVFEGNKLAHGPTMKFRPKWIYDVLDTKTIMFKSFQF